MSAFLADDLDSGGTHAATSTERGTQKGGWAIKICTWRIEDPQPDCNDPAHGHINQATNRPLPTIS